jgi:hypothetical protein
MGLKEHAFARGFVAWRTKELTADPQQKLEQVLTHLLCLEQGR